MNVANHSGVEASPVAAGLELRTLPVGLRRPPGGRAASRKQKALSYAAPERREMSGGSPVKQKSEKKMGLKERLFGAKSSPKTKQGIACILIS